MSSRVRDLAVSGMLISFLLILSHVISIYGVKTVDTSGQSRIGYYQQLVNDLLNRPAARHKIPPGFLDDTDPSYNMSFQLWLADISDIDELSQVITVNVYVDVHWTQQDLTWNPADYGGIDLVLVQASDIWTPLVLVVMGQQGSDVLQFAATVRLTSDGVARSARHNYLTFTCNIHFLRYPFDIQECTVGFLPTGVNVRPNIKFTNLSDYPLQQFVSIKGEWSLLASRFEVVSTRPTAEIALFTFSVKRESTYYVITCIFPLVLTSVMIPLTFLVPAKTGEKVSYLVAMFTSTAIFLNYISDVMSRSLGETPYLAMLLMEVLVEGLLAVLACVLVVNTHLQEHKVPMGSRHEREEGAAVKNENDLTETFKSSTSTEVCKDSPQTSKSRLEYMKSLIHRLTFLKLTSQQMDRTFFCLFMTGQLTFLVAIFGLTDWVFAA